MRTSWFASMACVGFMGGLSALARAEAEWDEGVLVLTDSNFDEEIARYDHLLVEFYAPWCGHCKKLAPEYAAAAAELASKEPARYVAKVDATENKELGERFGIRGFPTLHWFSHGQRSDYNGGRTKDTIVNWIMKKTGPASVEVACADLKAQIGDAKLAWTFFGCTECDKYKAHVEAADNPAVSENYRFFHTDKDCGAEYGLTDSGFVLFRTFDESPLTYSDENFSASALVDFMTKHSTPRFITFSEDYIEPIFGHKRPALILFTEESDSAAQKAFHEAADAMQGEILFVQSGASDGIQQRLAEFVGVEKKDLPTVRLIDPSETMKKFTFEGDSAAISVDEIRHFVNQFKSGSINPSYKSEPIPETQEGATVVVVGKSYTDVVMDPTKDVLVKYYAPWCGHCKKLAPIWDELAEHVADVEDLVIAKYDATANENEGVEVRGYPTLIYYPKNNKKGVTYEGDRELEGLKQWLNENSQGYKNSGKYGSAEPVQEEL